MTKKIILLVKAVYESIFYGFIQEKEKQNWVVSRYVFSDFLLIHWYSWTVLKELPFLCSFKWCFYWWCLLMVESNVFIFYYFLFLFSMGNNLILAFFSAPSNCNLLLIQSQSHYLLLLSIYGFFCWFFFHLQAILKLLIYPS